MERNDCHSPKNLIPADYEYVAPDCIKIEGLGDVEYIKQCRLIIKAHMDRTGGTHSKHTHGGNCGVCGSVNAVYTVLFYHAKTNSYVRVGQECAELIDANVVPHFNQLRKAVANVRDFQKGKQKAYALLSDRGLEAAYVIWDAGGEVPREEMIIRDIVGKLVKYGSISDAQFNFIKKLLNDIQERPAREAARAAEATAAADCPTGKTQVAGEVISVRVDDTPFGKVTKMLVKAKEGFKVWCTMPAWSNADRGDQIVFKAELEQSKDDAKFGFGKRPSLVSVTRKETGVTQTLAQIKAEFKQ